MYFAVFATDKPDTTQQRSDLQPDFIAYLRDHRDHPDVTVHNGGPLSAMTTEKLLSPEGRRVRDWYAAKAGPAHQRRIEANIRAVIAANLRPVANPAGVHVVADLTGDGADHRPRRSRESRQLSV